MLTLLLLVVSFTCFSVTSKAYGVGNIKVYDFGGGTPTIRFYNRDVEEGINVEPFLTYVSGWTENDISESGYSINSNGIQGVDVDILSEQVFEIHEVTNKVHYLQEIDIYSISCDANIQQTQGGSWDTIEIEWNNVIIQPDVLSSYLLNDTTYENLLSNIYFWVDCMAYWDITFRVQNEYGTFEYVNLITQDEGIDGLVSVLPTNYQNSFSISDINEFMDMYGGNWGYIYIEKAICEITSFQSDVTELTYTQIVTDYDSQNEFIQYQGWYNYDNIANFGDVGESISSSVSNFLKTEILPNFTILNLLLIVIAIPLLIYILKLFLGG